MTLAPGTRLGPYEVASLVGAGGMGEVYKGRDTRLARAVAIKVLRADVAERLDRRARFETEIRAISSLNHPHICTVFDVGEQDGLAYLVMEYLEGETLDDRMARAPLSAGDVLTFAAQMADALDHAHQALVTHRDLKPSNVMLTSQGVKLLDFGLAQTAPLGAAAAQATMTVPAMRLTSEGTILGTFQYMAPEQLEGKNTDARTDVFALGTLLFEMATGRTAFEGGSQASLIASILTSRPPTVSSARHVDGDGTLPPALDHIVDRCLAKNPDERWQSVRDVKLELQWIVGGDSFSIAKTESRPSRRYGPVWLWMTAGIALALGVGWSVINRSTRSADAVRFTIAPPPGSVIARSPVGTRLALSPDGRHIAFVATAAGVDRLWIRRLDSLTPMAVAEGVESPFWSPDSQYIGFFAPGEGRLKKVAIAGGPALEICPAAVIDAPVWHPNGTILFAQVNAGIFRVRAEGGTPVQLTHVDAPRREINHVWPEWLPDGRHFVYTATGLNSSGRRAPRAVYIRSVDSDDQRLLTHAESRMQYSAPGYLLHVEQGALLAQAFDARTRALVGEPMKVADDLSYSRTVGNAGFTVSRNGVLAYYGGVTRSELTWFDRAGRATASGWGPQPFASSIRLSPDGQRVLADIEDPRAGASDLWIYDLSRRVSTRFTTDAANETTPVWSADGSRVVFSSDGGGSPDMFLKTTDGLGSDEMILSKPGPQQPTDVSADGEFVIFDDNNRETGLDVWLLRLTGTRGAQPLIRTRFQEFGARLSPDGRWVAFVSNETGSSEIYVASLRGANEKTRISAAGGIAPRWRRDGKELFFVASDTNTVMAAAIGAGTRFTAGPPVALFSMRTPASRRRAREIAYDVSPDGQRFLVNTPPEEVPVTGITVVMNWTSGLAAARR